jgi:tRNA threonylcarbamoyl adenosine modification protein YeaZ
VILAIDGASPALSVAVASDDGELIADVSWTSAQRQSAELMPRLLALLDETDRRLGDVTAVAIGTGPGSFTGLRVAMALGKGLAFAGLGPIVGVPSLAAWLDQVPTAAAAVARAGAREAYVLAAGEEMVRIVDRDQLSDLVAGRSIVAPEELADRFGLAGAVEPSAAPAIAGIAALRLQKTPEGDDLARLEPIYLRAPRGVTTSTEGAVRWL